MQLHYLKEITCYYMFAAYIDDVINHMHNKQVGCHYVNACIVMYTDEILLLAR